MASSPKAYLTFRLARHDLAMEASRVRGILPLSELIPIPGVLTGLLGFTALRGEPVAVLDLCEKLGLHSSRPGSQPKIVILEVISEEGPHMAAFMADRISDVVVYRERNLHNGVLKGKGRPRKLIDFDRLVSEGVLAVLWSS